MSHRQFRGPVARKLHRSAGFNQVFVNAVRATGGNNASRTLITQGYTTDINYTIDICGAPVPADTAAGRLMMEFHYYDPFDFSLNTGSSIWQWGSIATDPNAEEAAFNEAYVDAQMQKLKTTYSDKGIPIIIGEFGAILRSDVDPTQKYRNYWDQMSPAPPSGTASRRSTGTTAPSLITRWASLIVQARPRAIRRRST